MSMPERYHPECPPDAHKVIRPAETEVLATICVRVPDGEDKNGLANVIEILSLMGKNTVICCSQSMKDLLVTNTKGSDVSFDFLRIHDDGKASVAYSDGAVGPSAPLYDFAKDGSYDKFLSVLEQKCFVIVDMPSMFTLRSISTVYPWDKLLANQFLGQYLSARKDLTDKDRSLLEDVRYGRFDALKVEEESKTAYKFLRLERKLFLQYPTEDD
ncbi:MAG: hypothetical protein ACI4UM_04745 [Succinivibrio sp.]